MNTRIILGVLCGLAVCGVYGAHGHGVGYEVLPPVPLGDKMVSLEVTSSQYENPDGADREIQFSLSYMDEMSTVRDVTYHIAASKGEVHLFDGMFEAPDGVFVFVLEGAPHEDVTLETEVEGGFFESIAGAQKELVLVRGAQLQTGGLYEFEVEVTTDAHPGEPPVSYDVGLSIPDETLFGVTDPDYGEQTVGVITYYDVISDFGYDPASRTVSFSMPFDWDEANIRETSVVHEEISLERSFGHMQAARYEARLNGVQVPQEALTIDDFGEKRIIHLVLSQDYLLGVAEGQAETNSMRFEFGPEEGSPLGVATENGQFYLTLGWDPQVISSGSVIKFDFDIMDTYLRERIISAEYDVSLIQHGEVMADASGTTSEGTGEFVAFIPAGVRGIITVEFANLEGARLARAAIPVFVGGAAEVKTIPDWVREDARSWAAGETTDLEFTPGMTYLVEPRAEAIPQQAGVALDQPIPDWVKDGARWWSEGLTSDADFMDGMGYLAARGVIPERFWMS